MVTPQSRIPGIPAWPLQTQGGTVESMDRVDKKVAGKAYNQHRVITTSDIRHQTLHWLVTARLMLMCVRTLNPALVVVVVVAGADTGADTGQFLSCPAAARRRQRVAPVTVASGSSQWSSQLSFLAPAEESRHSDDMSTQ